MAGELSEDTSTSALSASQNAEAVPVCEKVCRNFNAAGLSGRACPADVLGRATGDPCRKSGTSRPHETASPSVVRKKQHSTTQGRAATPIEGRSWIAKSNAPARQRPRR